MKRFPSIPQPGAPEGVLCGPVVDCHQHLWTEVFADLLRSRSEAPYLRGWRLHLDGEPAYDVEPAQHDLDLRRKTDAADDVDRVLYSLSSPLGIEALEPDDAAPLLAAWHALADDLADETAPPGEATPPGAGGINGAATAPDGIWAAVNLVEPDLPGLRMTLAHPRVVGLQVPATAMRDPEALERLAPVLAVTEAAGLPLLVHPGPVEKQHGEAPAWWSALTSYPAQQAAAWFAWHVAGRSLLPGLRIGFVALAGLAPLHHERLAQRGGALGPIDPAVYYETSSYGTRAIDAVARVVGVDPLVHGSDRPYAVPTDPGLGGAFGRALFVTNPAHLLNGGPR